MQRQLPQGIVLDVTYYLNFTNQLLGAYNVNQVDPRVMYQYKDAINKSVPNPFYNYLTVDKFPGSLRYQQNVSLTSLMRPYPQYGNLNVIDGINGGGERYQSFQLRLDRRFANGASILMGYNYAREQDQVFFNDIDTFQKTLTWQETDRPRHRISAAGTWEIPVGKGRAALNRLPRVADMLIGGWDLSGLLTWRSGFFVRFGGLEVTGDPRVDNPTQDRWFNTSAFKQLPNYTPRTNPWQYPGLTNPGLLNLDSSIVKRAPITEKYRFELRVDMFNALNNMTWANPNTSVQSSLFGKSNNQLANTFGRRSQLGLRSSFSTTSQAQGTRRMTQKRFRMFGACSAPEFRLPRLNSKPCARLRVWTARGSAPNPSPTTGWLSRQARLRPRCSTTQGITICYASGLRKPACTSKGS